MRKIIVAGHEYTMPKMPAETYMEFLDVQDTLEEHMDAKGRYVRSDITAMTDFICKAYGNHFAPAQLLESADITSIIMEFNTIDLALGDEIQKRTEKLTANFTKTASKG